MVNFLKETREKILCSNHIEQDVMFVGSYDGKYRINWSEFEEIANFEYDNGHGSQEIASDLIVYFNDGSWLERCEYDGSEWWFFVDFKSFSNNDSYKKFSKLIGCWDSLENINQ